MSEASGYKLGNGSYVFYKQGTKEGGGWCIQFLRPLEDFSELEGVNLECLSATVESRIVDFEGGKFVLSCLSISDEAAECVHDILESFACERRTLRIMGAVAELNDPQREVEEMSENIKDWAGI